MAEFAPAFEQTLAREGGYRLTNVPNDRGGMTFAGIARRSHPSWSGWKLVDAGAGKGDPFLRSMVEALYRTEFWNRIRGDSISDQANAEALFDCAVNLGPLTAAMTAQCIVGTAPDGVIGPITLSELNQIDPLTFRQRLALERLRLYAEICGRDRSQRVFLLGWINRALALC